MSVNIMPHLARLGRVMLGENVPKWMYPVFTAAAAAPIVGYAARKHKPAQPEAVPGEELISKASAAIDLALGKTAAGDDMGQGINLEPTPQELAKQRLTNIQSLNGLVSSARQRKQQANRPKTPTLQSKGDYPQDSDPKVSNLESIRPEYRSNKS